MRQMIQQKIVAIGGGRLGQIWPDGVREPYETPQIDQTIVALANRSTPHLLFLAHAQTDPDREATYLAAGVRNFNRLGCDCRTLARQIERKLLVPRGLQRFPTP